MYIQPKTENPMALECLCHACRISVTQENTITISGLVALSCDVYYVILCQECAKRLRDDLDKVL